MSLKFYFLVLYEFNCAMYHAFKPFTVSFVTGSVKTGHNHTSLNLQYNALNVLGELVAYYL